MDLQLSTCSRKQGVVTNILDVLTPATGIKVRSSGQAIKLETIKRSRRSFALLKSKSRRVLSLTPPTPHPLPVGNQRSRLFQRCDQAIKKIARSRVLSVCACYKHIQSIDIDEKLVCTGFELLKKAY